MRRLLVSLSATAAPAALFAALGASATAGVLPELPMLENGGGGYVYIDYDEGTVPPGLHAVTIFENNHGTANDFAWTGSQGGQLPNCVRASVPGDDVNGYTPGGFAVCDTGPHSGKRIKIELTGQGPTDIRFEIEDSGGITEYYNYFKTWNLSGARVLGIEVQVGTGMGDSFVVMDPDDPARAVLFDENSITRFRLPDGLFGAGGQGEGKPIGIGFFDGGTIIVETPEPGSSGDRTTTGTGMGLGNGGFIDGGLKDANDFYVLNFGAGILDDSMVPTAILWDITGTSIDKPLEDGEEVYEVQIAWYDLSKDTWFYGNLGRDDVKTGDADLDFVYLQERLEALAEALDVDLSKLTEDGTDPRSGVEVPADILALMQANDAFFTEEMEDIRNTNFNFVLDVGDIPAGEYTLRIVPIFAPIAEQSVSPFEFRAAGYLDGMANVPYLDIDNADEYQAAITDIMAMPDATRHNAVESTSFSFAGAFTGLGLDLARPHVFALGQPVAERGSDGVTLSTMGAGGWSITENLRGFADIHGARATHAETWNNIGYDTSTRTISAGVEMQVTPAVSFGVLLGGVDGTADAHLGRGSIDASGWTVAAFGRAAFGAGGTVQGIVGYQDLSFDTTRHVMVPNVNATASGSTGGSQTFAALQADYMFHQGALSWGPMASVEHYALSVDGFDESGAGAWDLSVGDQSGSVTLMSAGLRGEMSFGVDQATRAHGRIAMTRATGDNRLIAAGFTGLPQASLPVDGFEQDWVDVSLGVSTTISRNAGRETRIGAEYRGAFGDGYDSQGLGVFLSMTF